MIKRLTNRTGMIAVWLWNGKWHILSFIAAVITVLYLLKLLNFYPNTVAIFLSLTGLLIILMQQVIDARLFAYHKPNTVHNWIRSFPRSRIISIKGSAIGVATVIGKARIQVLAAKGASSEQKIEFLLKRVEELQDSVANVDDKVDQVKASFKNIQNEFQQNIDGLSSSIKSLVAGHIVGSYDLNLFGITITICGTLIQFFSFP